MSQTDRQPDKSTWWSITAFDEGEKEWLAAGVYPSFVEKLFGGLEKCPDTGKVHFQGALKCRSQQRFSAIKKILPKSHIEAAKSSSALQKYAMKAETAVGEKAIYSNERPYYTLEAILTLLAVMPGDQDIDIDDDFWNRVVLILIKEPWLVGLLVKPDTLRAWRHTRPVWVARVSNPETGELLTREECIVLHILPGGGGCSDAGVSNPENFLSSQGINTDAES